MNPYYLSVMEQISREMAEQKYQQAYQTITQELSVPYIPQDVEPMLQSLLRECAAHLPRRGSGMSPEKLSRLIHGSPEQQEAAVAALSGLSLRLYPDLVEDVLESEVSDLIKGQLIEALMEQKIEEEYRMEKGGLEIDFIPSAILPASQDPGIQEALGWFETWFSSSRPDLELFCRSLLEQEIWASRPFDFQEEDGRLLAGRIVKLVFEALQDQEGYQTFLKEHELEPADSCRLHIEGKGDFQ